MFVVGIKEPFDIFGAETAGNGVKDETYKHSWGQKFTMFLTEKIDDIQVTKKQGFYM